MISWIFLQLVGRTHGHLRRGNDADHHMVDNRLDFEYLSPVPGSKQAHTTVQRGRQSNERAWKEIPRDVPHREVQINLGERAIELEGDVPVMMKEHVPHPRPLHVHNVSIMHPSHKEGQFVNNYTCVNNVGKVAFFELSRQNAEQYRKDVIRNNSKRIHQNSFTTFRSVNGYNMLETIERYNSSNLTYHCLEFDTYGTLANFLTKYYALKMQIACSIPIACWMEDDLEIDETFEGFIENIALAIGNTSREESKADMIRLGRWGEGYVTSIDGARRIVEKMEHDGIRHNIDQQLARYEQFKVAEVLGKKIWMDWRLRMRTPHRRRQTLTPWTVMSKTNQGDCLKTESISHDPKDIQKYGFPPSKDEEKHTPRVKKPGPRHRRRSSDVDLSCQNYRRHLPTPLPR